MLVGVLIALVGSVIWVRQVSGPFRYTSIKNVPARPVALVLGNRAYPDGTVSRLLAGRLDLALRLYRAGKVGTVLVSGDASGRGIAGGYNEVDPMRQWLIGRGVPADKVVGDYAGMNTYDSCVRARRVFGVDRVTVVTQAYHLPRAVTLCRKVGLDAVGVAADSRGVSALDMKRRAARDDLACTKAVLELIVRPEAGG